MPCKILKLNNYLMNVPNHAKDNSQEKTLNPFTPKSTKFKTKENIESTAP